MTLGELINRYRPHLMDESVGMRRSWEEVFTYTLRHYSADTPLENFNTEALSDQLSAAGMHPGMVAGYVTRWRNLLARANEL